MLLTNIEQFRKARRIHTVDLGDALSVNIFEPFIADIEKFSTLADEDFEGLGNIFASLICDDKGKFVFKSGSEVVASLSLSQVDKLAKHLS